ncbi:carnitine 3-dehydrogenase, partial [Rhodobacterales bacterium HKCCE3408]|nr:carnitine 3-dehydrogenase [Rhodobacterales bacterium HKCCE3408]
MGHLAILGAGRRGADWAARAILMGVDVAVTDPDAGAADRIAASLAAAEAALPALYDVALPARGSLRFGDLADVMAGAGAVMEALPNDAGLRRDVIAAALPHLPANAVILSSARIIAPGALKALGDHPERIARVRMADPVWLWPLAHLDGSRRAGEVLAGLGIALADEAAALDETAGLLA